MSSTWIRQQLGDFLTFQRGFDITKKEQRPGTYRVISSSGPSSYHDEARVKGPGVVIGRKGSLGGVYYSKADFWPHDTTLWIKDFKGNDPQFTYYFLKTLGLEHFDVGAANPTLNRNHLHLLPISTPPLATQRKTTAVLASYDELIENNLLRIEILEDMAQAVYREWLVNLRFPGHEDVALVDSPLGPIPEGWELAPLDTLAGASRGLSWSRDRETNSEEGTPVLTIPNIGPYLSPGGATRLVDVSSKERERFSLEEGDVLMIGSNGNPQRVGQTVRVPAGTNALFASFLMRIRRTPERTSSHLLHLQLRDSRLRGQLQASAVGATSLRNIRITALRSAVVVVPNRDVLKQFDSAVGPMFKLQDRLIETNSNLRATRDLLLPKLVSGGIDVSDLDIDTEWLAS